MSDDGTTKDDVKVPENEVGDKISKMFTEDGKDTSQFSLFCLTSSGLANNGTQTSLFSLLWGRRPPWTVRRLLNKEKVPDHHEKHAETK